MLSAKLAYLILRCKSKFLQFMKKQLKSRFYTTVSLKCKTKSHEASLLPSFFSLFDIF